MRSKYSCVAAMVVLSLVVNLGVRAQQTSKELSIEELKQQIVKLQAIEADPTMPTDVRAINRTFLEQRRTQLRALLQKNIDELQRYREAASSALTADEIKLLNATIAERQNDLASQPGGASVARPAASGSELRAVGEPASTRSSETVVAAPASPAGPSNRSEFVAVTDSVSPPAVFAAAPPRLAAVMQDLTLRGSDPTAPNPIKDDIRVELAKLTTEVLRAQPSAGVTLAQARKTAFDVTANPKLFAEILSRVLTNEMLPREEFVRDIELARIDKQVGGDAGNAGSTTLVTKGGTPEIIGFAVENGGLTRTIDGTTVTLRGNPIGLVEMLQKKGFMPAYEDDSTSAKLLRKLSFSASFDTSQGDLPGTFTARRQQLSGYSFRYEFKNDRDPRNERYKKDWEALVSNHAQVVANDLSLFQNLFDTFPAYRSWLTAAQDAVAKASTTDLPEVIAQQFESLQDIKIPPDLEARLQSFKTNFTAYRSERSKLLEIIAKGPIFTFEYVNNRRPGLIDTSNLKFIAETGLFKGKGDLTYNGSFTLFNANPGAGQSRLRDFENSLRLDIPLGDVRKVGNFVFTFAGQYKRVTEDEMPGVDNKGDIATGQLQFTIPIKGTGFKIPISLSFANRTEFVKEKEVRGNFGFTFDLDSIFAKFKPF